MYSKYINAMHCNLRPPDTETVIFCFYWDVCVKFEVSQPISCSHRFRYLTLRCDLDRWHCNLDLWPLTFDLWSWTTYLLPVMWWNFVLNLSKVEQSAQSYCNLTLWPWTRVTWSTMLSDCSGIISIKFKLSQLIRSCNITFSMLIRYIKL